MVVSFGLRRLPPFEHGQKMGAIIFSKYFYPFSIKIGLLREYYVQKDNYFEINPLKLTFDTVFDLISNKRKLSNCINFFKCWIFFTLMCQNGQHWMIFITVYEIICTCNKMAIRTISILKVVVNLFQENFELIYIYIMYMKS